MNELFLMMGKPIIDPAHPFTLRFKFRSGPLVAQFIPGLPPVIMAGSLPPFLRLVRVEQLRWNSLPRFIFQAAAGEADRAWEFFSTFMDAERVTL